jgi:polyphosphate kinase
LEHSRIFYFENAGTPEVFLGSADWMQRNLYERVEVVFPLRDEALRDRIVKEILPAYLADTRKARLLGPDGRYTRPQRGRARSGFSVQEHLMRMSQTMNGSGSPGAQQSALAYTNIDGLQVPSEPVDELEKELPGSANATI